MQFSLIQPFEQLKVNEENILNEFDCPLLQLEEKLINIPPNSIMHICSIMHECTKTCKCKQSTKHSLEFIEWENIPSRKKYVYHHDIDNTMYALNVYCCKSLDHC